MADLGFAYTPFAVVRENTPERRRACFRARKALEGIVYDTVALEGNPFTFPEVKTLLDGITVGGHPVSDQQQVLNQAASWAELLARVEAGSFRVSADAVLSLHRRLAYQEALAWGVLRDGPVSVAGTNHTPPSCEALPARLDALMDAMTRIDDPFERGGVFFLSCALDQFFWDGNKRTGRLVMNGILLDAGYDAVTIPAAERLAFNEKMIRFYDTRGGDEMFEFLAGCALDKGMRLEYRAAPQLGRWPAPH